MKTFKITAVLFALTTMTAACSPVDLARLVTATEKPQHPQDFTATPRPGDDCTGGNAICEDPNRR
jgi:hypothetical protein